MGEIFHLVFTQPTTNILLFFQKIFGTLGIPGAFGFSIIALTVTIRFLLNPFFKKQSELTTKMQELKPQLDAISKKHKDDKKKQQEEQLKLYQQHGINPAGGCLFALIQLPVFISLYRVIFQFVETKNAKEAIAAINQEAYIPALKISQINPAFFGFDLTATPSQFSKLGIYYLAIPLITGLLQYLQVSMATPATTPVKQEKGKKGEEDMQTAMSSQMKLIFPLMIGYFSYSLPVGLSLYWNIFSIFSIIQYRKKTSVSLAVGAKAK